MNFVAVYIDKGWKIHRIQPETDAIRTLCGKTGDITYPSKLDSVRRCWVCELRYQKLKQRSEELNVKPI